MSAVSAFLPRASIPHRPQNFQWCWNSCPDLCNDDEDWREYADVENEIIEDAFNANKEDVEIDGDYVINLKRQVQYRKGENDEQRAIKRVQFETKRVKVRLGTERFSLPVTPARSTTSSSTASDKPTETYRLIENCFGVADFPETYFRNEVLNTWKSLAHVVEEAISGIMKEGARLSKSNQAKWLAEQLRAVQQFGKSFGAEQQSRHPSKIGQMCVFLYTKDSFWYKLINSILRDPNTITCEHVKTFGPFCWLLDRYIGGHAEEDSVTDYRGVTLSDEQRKEFMRADEMVTFASFTSTTKNRMVAEMYSGNSLLIMDIRGSPRGEDISSLSNFPDEEEYLLWTGTAFKFFKYEYDSVKKQHIIYLRSAWFLPASEANALMENFNS